MVWFSHSLRISWFVLIHTVRGYSIVSEAKVAALRGSLAFPDSTAATKSLQSCPTLCNPIDGSPPGFPVRGILQARTLEWVAISFSNAWNQKVKVKSHSLVRLLVTPWTAAHQAPPSMGFSRQECWSRVPLPSPYTPKIGELQYIRQMLTTIKGQIDSNTITIWDFNTPLTPMDRSSKQKINKETQALSCMLDHWT